VRWQEMLPQWLPVGLTGEYRQEVISGNSVSRRACSGMDYWFYTFFIAPRR
jgi:hypothetical protein